MNVHKEINSQSADPSALVKSIAESLKALLHQPAEEEHGYYDNADMKRLLNISDKTLYRWRRDRLVEFVKMRGKFYYPKSVLRNLRMRQSAGE